MLRSRKEDLEHVLFLLEGEQILSQNLTLLPAALNCSPAPPSSVLIPPLLGADIFGRFVHEVTIPQTF